MKKVIGFTILFLIIGGIMGINSFAGQGVRKAIFAGGCFWCMEADFEKIPGVQDAVSGYIGGISKNPTYKDYGKNGHREAVEITYDSSLVTYEELLNLFWLRVDPTDAGGQFCDRGYEYSTAIFYNTEEEKRLAEQSKESLDKSGRLEGPIVTPIIKAAIFYRAEDYHQNYYKKNALKYKFYRFNCGRDQRLKKLWGDSKIQAKTENDNRGIRVFNKQDLKTKLTPLQYQVTQNNGTEPAFKNEYWDNKREGIYVDIVSGEPLFISVDKFQSGTGWPSFTKPLEPDNIVEKDDKSFFMTRREVRSRQADSHLGHIFKDGSGPTRLRYCINSAALRFIPKEDLEQEGYSKYKKLFEE